MDESPDLSWLKGQRFAHRGLFCEAESAPENSRAAFKAAIAVGHGFELDVQVTADGIPMAFHDRELTRLAGKAGLVDHMIWEDLSGFTLQATTETIPTLAEALEIAGKKAPVLVEIKKALDPSRVAAAVDGALEGHPGPVAVMSFDPRIVRWFMQNRPDIARGLVAGPRDGPKWLRNSLGPFVSHAFCNPHFTAFDVSALPSPYTKWIRKKEAVVATWTVRTEVDAARAERHADAFIYERPDARTRAGNE